MVAAVLVAAGILTLCHYFLLARRREIGSEARLPRQLLLLALTILAFVVIVLLAPIPESTRNQILSLLGIVLSGVIALSSAPFVTNFMAAVMLRVTKPFVVGDFIRVGDWYGKVAERGLFDTEVQTENRELVAIPNATFINQPVIVTRSSGIIVSTTLSLGYDLSASQAEPLLLTAATEAGLTDPYVHVVELGDFAVSYKVSGLLLEVQNVLTTRSELNRQILTTLHRAGVEIASPTIARHIPHPADSPIIPAEQPVTVPNKRVKAEEIVFDKATQVEQLEQAREQLKAQILELQDAKDADKEIKKSMLQSLADIEEELKHLRAQP